VAEGIPGIEIPAGWRVVDRTRVGPFVTGATLQRPDGTQVHWSSRAHRKRLGLHTHPSASSLRIGILFMIGSFCFAIGSVPLYFDNVDPSVCAWTFFIGSIFFTSAGYLQYKEVLDAPAGPDTTVVTRRGLTRWLDWSPRQIDWWATLIQFIGTIFFNVTTFAATRDALSFQQEKHLIWAPDVFGSICFLVASWLAFSEVTPRLFHWRNRSIGWWIAALNLVGSIAFGASAVASRYLTTTEEVANIWLVNAGTFVGAVCFFVGAALLPVESARSDD
jgi:YrhK-like protein